MYAPDLASFAESDVYPRILVTTRRHTQINELQCIQLYKCLASGVSKDWPVLHNQSPSTTLDPICSEMSESKRYSIVWQKCGAKSRLAERFHVPGYDGFLPKAPLAPNVACLDYSAGCGGPLVAYRFDSERILNTDRFVTVE
jgi:hypothetical protein